MSHFQPQIGMYGGARASYAGPQPIMEQVGGMMCRLPSPGGARGEVRYAERVTVTYGRSAFSYVEFGSFDHDLRGITYPSQSRPTPRPIRTRRSNNDSYFITLMEDSRKNSASRKPKAPLVSIPAKMAKKGKPSWDGSEHDAWKCENWEDFAMEAAPKEKANAEENTKELTTPPATAAEKSGTDKTVVSKKISYKSKK